GGQRRHREAPIVRDSARADDGRPGRPRPADGRAGAGGSHRRFRARDRPAAAGRARDLRAARRRGLQAPGDRGDARDRDRDIETPASSGANADAQASGWIMTMHEEWTDRLSDYLDGELAADEQ